MFCKSKIIKTNLRQIVIVRRKINVLSKAIPMYDLHLLFCHVWIYQRWLLVKLSNSRLKTSFSPFMLQSRVWAHTERSPSLKKRRQLGAFSERKLWPVYSAIKARAGSKINNVGFWFLWYWSVPDQAMEQGGWYILDFSHSIDDHGNL